jgi:hypothetical protein
MGESGAGTLRILLILLVAMAVGAVVILLIGETRWTPITR